MPGLTPTIVRLFVKFRGVRADHVHDVAGDESEALRVIREWQREGLLCVPEPDSPFRAFVPWHAVDEVRMGYVPGVTVPRVPAPHPSRPAHAATPPNTLAFPRAA
jgi:hypothetical protein